MGKKKRKFDDRAGRKHRLDPFLDFDDDLELIDRRGLIQDEELYAFDLEPFDYEDPHFEQSRIPFDLDVWREDLASRSAQRQRMRQRDLNRGLY